MKRNRRSYFIFICIFIMLFFIITQFNLIRKSPLNTMKITITKATPTTITMLPSSKSTSQEKLKSMNNVVIEENQVIVLVIACNRVTVTRCLDLLIKYRPSKQSYPILVSQDCDHLPTEKVIKAYGDELTYIKHMNKKAIVIENLKLKRFMGYYKISRHYKWALGQVFDVRKAKAVIIVEDDLEISSDFFSYFGSLYPILTADKTLYCVSAWNDNGMTIHIENKPELLYRTDFFPGLGWMMTNTLWTEIGPKWPASFWDDWIRETQVRRNRSCIRPEIPRTSTFGKKGISNGLFYDKILKFVVKNNVYVDFSKSDLTYLYKINYDDSFVKKVYAVPLIKVNDVKRYAKPIEEAVRLEYDSLKVFVTIAKTLAIMSDERSNVPRTAYKGIVSVIVNNRRIYITPKLPWVPY